MTAIHRREMLGVMLGGAVVAPESDRARLRYVLHGIKQGE
jgi:hypothetical protein